MTEIEEEIYRENILEHNKNPRNKRVMENPTIIYGENNPLCGDHIMMYLKIEKGKIADISFTGNGCAISQASVSLLTEAVKSKKIAEAAKIDESFINSLLGVKISLSRKKCAMLSLYTLKKALERIK